MEVNRFRGTTLDSWKTYAAVPFCHMTPPNNISLFVAGSGKSILWFVDLAFAVFVSDNQVAFLSPVRRSSKTLKPYAIPVKPQSRIFTSTSETSTNNTGAT